MHTAINEFVVCIFYSKCKRIRVHMPARKAMTKESQHFHWQEFPFLILEYKCDGKLKAGTN